MAEIIPIHQHKEDFNDCIKNLSELCKEDLTSINTLILEKLDSSVPLIHEIGNKTNFTRGKKVIGLINKIKKAKNFKKQTLSGCIFEKVSNSIVISSEN